MNATEEKNVIPQITHPLGRHWRQPESSKIQVDDTHAAMSKEDFDLLSEYSCSVPSGVYEGKMWKAKQSNGKWYLRWYDFCEDPEKCSINKREILIVE